MCIVQHIYETDSNYSIPESGLLEGVVVVAKEAKASIPDVMGGGLLAVVVMGGGKEANPMVPLLLELVGVVLKALKGSKEELVAAAVPLEVGKVIPPAKNT